MSEQKKQYLLVFIEERYGDERDLDENETPRIYRIVEEGPEYWESYFNGPDNGMEGHPDDVPFRIFVSLHELSLISEDKEFWKKGL